MAASLTFPYTAAELSCHTADMSTGGPDAATKATDPLPLLWLLVKDHQKTTKKTIPEFQLLPFGLHQNI